MNATTRYLQSLPQDADIDIPRLVNAVLIDAVAAGASDIHIEPWDSSIVVRVRVSGVLNELVHLPRDLMERLSGRLKVMADLIAYQTDIPQEGRASTFPEAGNVELRISTFPTVRGEKIVIRIFDPKNRSFQLDDLGFEADTLEAFKQLISRPHGLVLLTGPTGSGKTTAIYSALMHLVEKHGPSVSIATVEDPVEFGLPMVSQSQCNAAREYTYPVALRSLMRQDPQIIMIGEIRDAETAQIAVQAGLTGHMVLSTIHSGSTSGVFARLINMGIEPFLLASSIAGVLGLRLVRRNCPACSVPYTPEESLLHLVPSHFLDQTHFRKGEGCEACLHTGYGSRVTVTELLHVDDTLRDAVIGKVATRRLNELAIQSGMRTLYHTGLLRVLRGETTLEEVLRVVGCEVV